MDIDKREDTMKIIIPLFIIVSLLSVSVCLANEVALKEAYSLYYKGQKDAAIEKMEAYVSENPEPGVLYFLGYAYYEKKDMVRANEFFSKAFRLKDFYSPVSPKDGQ
ncbi:MAG: tetratricopeptide repeat protein [Nitrospiraceae bacterium]|nr:MAG: tetratricopeptide repeat protein [Nitrospiraceae bacterium]